MTYFPPALDNVTLFVTGLYTPPAINDIELYVGDEVAETISISVDFEVETPDIFGVIPIWIANELSILAPSVTGSLTVSYGARCSMQVPMVELHGSYISPISARANFETQLPILTCNFGANVKIDCDIPSMSSVLENPIRANGDIKQSVPDMDATLLCPNVIRCNISSVVPVIVGNLSLYDLFFCAMYPSNAVMTSRLDQTNVLQVNFTPDVPEMKMVIDSADSYEIIKYKKEGLCPLA